MRLVHFDWSSDQTIFFGAVFVVCMVLMMTLDKVSPKGQQRKARRTVTERPGDIID